MTWAVASFNFTAEDVSEVNLREGQRVEILDMSDPDWWKGRVAGGGGTGGLFPSNHVQLC